MEKLKGRLDAFSDGVIAIIITIMVLNLPAVLHDSWPAYLQLSKSIGIYLISYIFVANMWYQFATAFSEIDTITYRILLLDFGFLALLSLMPLFTNMMAENTTRVTVIAYGLLSFFVNFSFRSLAKAIIHMKYTDKSDMAKVYTKIYGQGNRYFTLLNFAVLILAYFKPTWAIIFYLVSPVWIFLANGDSRQEMFDVGQLNTNERKNWLNLTDEQRKAYQNYRRAQTDDETGHAQPTPNGNVQPVTPSKKTTLEHFNTRFFNRWLDQRVDPRTRQKIQKRMENMTPEQEQQVFERWYRREQQLRKRKQQRQTHQNRKQ
ncbi:hypothetical protein IV38_GL001230 [Lactobacillus selangorensis]|uniref:Integral membrane protein n=1 Tax=Lactobacillus selangorensis TaxID=81857 RepID=A0A0R2FW16_9LACO|nr:TMEM175 family protein [Lactobacillus selangorensis]KRN29015.1 hypothetical protein IV38_GL001230 [Lactobacillus selangorensis]KRN32575.1 hypothetical protein IV40_GL000623 [Lactobacillus selangorensis]